MQPKLTESDRILLIACLQIQNTQRQILEALGKPVNDIPKSDNAIEILQEGFEHFYDNALGCLNAQLGEEGVFSAEDSEEMLDVLDMYRGIGDYTGNNPKDDEVNNSLCVRFMGFDGNYESRQRRFVNFAVFRMELYSELKPKGKESKDFNSHHPMRDKYGRMVKVWRQVENKHKLTRDDVLAILKAGEK